MGHGTKNQQNKLRLKLFRVFNGSMCRFYQYSAVILSLLMICFILISHWLACIWIVIGRYQVESCLARNYNCVH